MPSEKPWFAPLSIPMERRMQTAVVAFWISLLPICAAIQLSVIAGVLALWYYGMTTAFTVAAGLIVVYAAHVATDTRWQRDGARWMWGMRSRFMQRVSALFCSFFPHKTVIDGVKSQDDVAAMVKQFPTTRNYLFCCHPHGVFGLGVWSTFIFNNPANTFFHNTVWCDEPKYECTVSTLSANFNVPLWREALMALGFVDASRGVLVRGLGRDPAAKMSRICALMPGGAAESIDCSEPILTLKKRKGFVKVALQTGASLVPVFSFGETKLYKPLAKAKGALRGILFWLQKSLGFAIPLVCGRGVFNYHIGIVPHREEMTTVIGLPVEVPKITDFTDADVDKYHAQYIAAVRDLYRRYQPKYDPECEYKELVLR